MKFCLHYTLPTPIDVDPWTGDISPLLKWRGRPVFCDFFRGRHFCTSAHGMTYSLIHTLWICDFVVYELLRFIALVFYKSVCIAIRCLSTCSLTDIKSPLYVISLLQTVLLLPFVPVKQGTAFLVLSVCPNKHPMGCEAQLAWKCLFMPTFWQAISTRKVGQTDLVFSMQSGFISRSMHARLQVSVCSGYDLCHPG